jgi:hemerythrin superfamily protein
MVVRWRRGRVRVEGEDVVELLVARHREVEQLIDAYEQSTTGPEDGEAILAELRRLLSIHEAVEEQLVHPLVRRQLPDGHRLAVEVVGQEQECREMLARIQDTAPGSDDRAEMVQRLFQCVRHHAQTEETAVFPLLRLHLGPRERMRLGAMVERAERLAPTHAPSLPAGNVVGMPVVRMLDRVRDRARR